MRSTFKSARLICGCAIAVALAAGVGRGQSLGQPASGNQPPVDDQLQESLEDGLLEGLDDLPAAGGQERSAGDGNSKLPPDDPQDEQLLDQLDGEDVGEAPEDPLSNIARKMRLAQTRLAGEKISQDTQGLQQQIVTDLEALIKQLQKQKKQSSSSSSASSQRPSGQNVQQPDKQPDSGQEKPSNKPARESTQRLGQQDAQPPDPEAVQALVKRVWGHLPDRARQEMQNVSVEEFLPKYREVIEDYFRRLAEEE
jgi:hypothetical protein